jgi:hypothetical protein
MGGWLAIGSLPRSRRRTSLVMLLALLLGLPACGGGTSVAAAAANPGTSPGNYTITVCHIGITNSQRAGAANCAIENAGREISHFLISAGGDSRGLPHSA